MFYTQLLLLLTALSVPTEIVENGVSPKGKAHTMSFKNELRLGPESGDDHYLWTGSVTLVVNEKGHIFVLDAGAQRVVQLGPDGKLVRVIGGKGDGPGEFVKPTNISMLGDGRIVVSEYRLGVNVYNFFDGEGKFLDRKSVSSSPLMFSSQFSPDGNHMAGAILNISQAGLSMTYGVLSKDLKAVLDLSSHKLPNLSGQGMQDPNWWPDFLAPWFRLMPKQGMMVYAPDGSLYTALIDDYKITRYTPDLKEDLVFKRAYKPSVLSEEALNQLLEPVRTELLSVMPPAIQTIVTPQVVAKGVEKAELSRRKSPIVGMAALEDGGLLVITDYDHKTGKTKGDLFNKTGELIGSVEPPPMEVNVFGGYFGFSAKITFKGGKAYTIENKEDELILNRYSYQLKPEP